MKVNYVEIDQDGYPLCVHSTEVDDPSEVPTGYEHLHKLNTWTGKYPIRPRNHFKIKYVAGDLVWVDSRTLSQVRADKWESIKAIRNELMDAPIAVGGVTVDGDGASRFNVMGAVLDMQLTGETTRGWICADNVRRVLTAAQLQQIGIAMAARTQTLVDIGDSLRTQINDPAKTTAAEVDAVVWPAP